MEFEAFDVEDDDANDDQAGGHIDVRVVEVDDGPKDEISQHLSNDEELDLSQNRGLLFTDAQIKSSRRYNYDENEKAVSEEPKEIDKDDDMIIHQVDHTAEIEQDIMPQNHSQALVNETE